MLGRVRVHHYAFLEALGIDGSAAVGASLADSPFILEVFEANGYLWLGLIRSCLDVEPIEI